jgi:hypothetical protein
MSNLQTHLRVRDVLWPKAWKEAIILALRKSNKEDYTVIETYRPIALLNTIEKLLKLIMAHKLSLLTKNNSILLET